MAIETHDKSDYFAEEALRVCDLYLKRSYYPPDLERFPASLASKVQPLGMNYYCRNAASTLRVLKTLGARLAWKGSGGLRTVYNFMVLPKVAAFEQPPDSTIEPAVVFQTRVWEAHEVGVGDHTINAERVALIRALKKAFGDRFRGGLVPTPYALANFPGDITTLPTRRSRYTKWSKNCLIGVYTRGLHQSIAAKLPECLAASQCLVAEPIEHHLPVPLEEGRNHSTFRDPDQCVAACRRLLEDHPFANSMRRANHDYYRREVEPAAHALRNIERVLKD